MHKQPTQPNMLLSSRYNLFNPIKLPNLHILPGTPDINSLDLYIIFSIAGDRYNNFHCRPISIKNTDIEPIKL